MTKVILSAVWICAALKGGLRVAVCVPFAPRRKRRLVGVPRIVHMSGPTSITSGR